MSFFTTFLETAPHFGRAIEQTEQELKTIKSSGPERLKLLVHLSYCYAHVQLQKGVAAAEEAITLAETLNDQSMKANALCAKAMNLLRIGYVARAQATNRQALAIFETINDEEGMCDACIQFGSLPNLSVNPDNIVGYVEQALKGYKTLGDRSGVYLARIQYTMHFFYKTQFEEGTLKSKTLIEELSELKNQHLICFTYMQLSIGMYLKQDVVQFASTMVEWQKIAEATGNFHDCSMIKAMLPECHRLQNLTKDVMQECLESIEYTEKLGSFHGHSLVSIIMANICSGQEQYADALLYYRKAMIAAHEIEDGFLYRMAQNAMSEVYLKSGQIAEARETFETARQEATAANDRLHFVAASRHLAELSYHQGEFDRALLDFKIIIDTASTSDGWNMQDYGSYASCIAKAGDVAMEKAGLKPEDRNSLRLHNLEKYLELAQLQISKREEANACNSLAEYYEETNDLYQAIQYRKKYIKLYEEIVNEESIKHIAKLRMQFETEKKEKEIVLLKKESEQALLNERLRISRDLHDDIGSTLGSIAVYSDVAKNRSMKNEKSSEVLSKIGAASRDLIEKMSDIVWSLNPDNENFEHMQSRMQVFASMMLTPRNISVEYTFNEELKAVQLKVDQRKNIYLIYKEAIYNIVKYAECKKVIISLIKSNNNLILNIKDDGNGFDTSSLTPLQKRGEIGGNGIINMKERAQDMKALLNIISKINEGTSVELLINVE
ncbi:MAG: histidine kinase [Bacteroidota bacterium]|nr:histidine kinase [Bacteroidota bacterium]